MTGRAISRLQAGKPVTLIRLAASVMLLAISCAGLAQAQSYDLIVRNGRVLDGTGNPWIYTNIAVSGDRIVAIGRLEGATARRVIDATDLYVAPGFIDVHSHAATGLVKRDLSAAQPLLAQGITTVIVNPDGGGAVDLIRQRRDLLEHGLGVNVGLLVPHGSVRRAVLGMDDRAPTPAEMDRMRTLVRAGMEAGAFGISTGPYYTPGSYATTEELIELSRVVAEFDGIYTSHIRDEADFSIGVVAATDEVIRIAREARLPGIVTHIKVLGPRVWGFSAALVSRIERAREEGVEVFADQYPYAASATGLVGALVPPWAQVGGDTALTRRIADPTERARLRVGIVDNLDRRGGAERIQFRRHEPDPSIEGRTLHDISIERSLHPADMTLALLTAGSASIVSFNMDERDIERLMRQPWTMTSSDGELVPMGEGVPHPRSYGTFPRKIREYVLDRGVVGLEQAIHSMTHLPASVHRMNDRGIIREGAIADIVILDLARVNDPADFRQPHRLAEGMVHVLVNGKPAIDGGRFTEQLHGRVLSRRGDGGSPR
ncbi:amidohydrolase family protein [soil metagenome]